jgi:hypothetical protein
MLFTQVTQHTGRTVDGRRRPVYVGMATGAGLSTTSTDIRQGAQHQAGIGRTHPWGLASLALLADMDVAGSFCTRLSTAATESLLSLPECAYAPYFVRLACLGFCARTEGIRERLWSQPRGGDLFKFLLWPFQFSGLESR